jgi:hypothetical protein
MLTHRQVDRRRNKKQVKTKWRERFWIIADETGWKKWHQWNLLSFRPKSLKKLYVLFVSSSLRDRMIMEQGEQSPRQPRHPFGETCPPSHISLTPFTLADLSQSFSILSDLKFCRSTFSLSTNHLWNAKPKEPPQKTNKESTFVFNCKLCFLSVFLHFDLSYFITT